MKQENEKPFIDQQEQADFFYEVLEALDASDLPKLASIRKSDENFPDGVDPWLGYHWINNAIDSCEIQGVTWILAQDVNLNFCDSGYTPLHSCIDRKMPGKYQIMETLIANGADVNAEGINGYAPLHLAAMRADYRAIDILLAAGADPHLETTFDDYATPEEEARELGDPHVANYLKSRTQEIPKKQKRFAGPFGLADPIELD